MNLLITNQMNLNKSYEINSYSYLCVLNPNNCLEQMEFKARNQESLYGAYLILGYKFLDSLNVNSGIRYGGSTSYDSNEKINYSLGADYIVNQFLKLKTFLRPVRSVLKSLNSSIIFSASWGAA